jgi:hypothetical protein
MSMNLIFQLKDWNILNTWSHNGSLTSNTRIIWSNLINYCQHRPLHKHVSTSCLLFDSDSEREIGDYM